MPRLVYECHSFDTATATCTQPVWVERPEPFIDLSGAQVYGLFGAIALLFCTAYGGKVLTRTFLNR